MTPARLAAVALAVVLAVLAVAIGAANVVPSSNAGVRSAPITAQSLAPPQCAGLGLTKVVIGTTGTSGHDLILGSAAAGTFTGNGGVDCMIGGAGDDSFTGNGPQAGDVCIGGPGRDKFKKCSTTYQ